MDIESDAPPVTWIRREFDDLFRKAPQFGDSRSDLLQQSLIFALAPDQSSSGFSL